MQQGHPRHKQLSRARHEMYLNVKREILENMVKGIRAVGQVYGRAVRNAFGISKTKPLEEATEMKDAYSETHKPKGLMQIVPPKFNQ